MLDIFAPHQGYVSPINCLHTGQIKRQRRFSFDVVGGNQWLELQLFVGVVFLWHGMSKAMYVSVISSTSSFTDFFSI